jgi:hypothetical protein
MDVITPFHLDYDRKRLLIKASIGFGFFAKLGFVHDNQINQSTTSDQVLPLPPVAQTIEIINFCH